MAFIIKEAIKNTYNRCAEQLDSFDDAQINAIYRFIDVINTSSTMYKMNKNIDRVSILEYLIALKNNHDELDEKQVLNRIMNILTAMSAMSLLKLEYNKN